MSKVTAAAPAGGASFVGAWPAWLMVVLVSVCAVIAFAPRALPPFPETRIQPQKLHVNSLARVGSRIIAAGEQGRILWADDANGVWQEAVVTPQRGSTLTEVRDVGEGLLIAIGHDGWILRSEDKGANWKEAHFNTESSDPLMGITAADGKLLAYGAFGLMMVSVDAGKSWQRETLNIEGGAAPAEAPAPAVAAEEDPFAAFMNGGGDSAESSGSLADRHLNDMTRTADGGLLLVGERGLMAKSSDNGATWKALPSIYKGSFYGVLKLPSDTLVVYGMRGHVFHSRDNGGSWTASKLPEPISMFGGTLTEEGHPVLVGDGNAVLVSTNDGADFVRVSRESRRLLADVLPLSSSEWITAGDSGVRRIAFNKK